MLTDNQRLLIQRAVDGDLSESEKAEFHALIESHAEARKFYHQIDNIGILARDVGTVDAPGSLKADVLRSVRRSSATSAPPRAFGALFGVLLNPRLAYGLAAGVVIGLGIGAMTLKSHTGQMDPLVLSGTILGGTNPKTLTRVDSDSFSDGTTKGRVAVDVANHLYYVQIELESSQDISADLEYDPSSYVVRAFEQAVPKPGSIMSGAGQVRATHSGRNRYLFVLEHINDESPAPVVLRITGTGTIYERSLEI